MISGFSNDVISLIKKFAKEIYPLISDTILNLAELKAKANIKQLEYYMEKGLSQDQAINLILNDKTLDRLLKEKLLSNYK